MSFQLVLEQSKLLLTIGWGVLLTATLGLSAACLAYGSRVPWPRLSANRRHVLVGILFVASLATAMAFALSPRFQSQTRASRGLPLIEVHAKIAPVPHGGLRLDTIFWPAAGADWVVSDVRIGVGVRALALFWGVVVVVLACRLVGGLFLVGRIRHRAVPITSNEVAARLSRIADRVAVTAQVELLESTEIDTPVTAGWRQPFVMFPAGMAATLGEHALELVLAHELAHVRRRDFVVGLIHAGADVITSLSPGHRWLSKEARGLREEACDDAVVALGTEPYAYARALEGLARATAGNRVMISTVCAANQNLAERIRRLLGEQVRGRPSRTRAVGALTLLCLAGFATAVLTAAARAQWSEPNAAAGQPSQVTKSLIPYGYYRHVPGSPFRISGVQPGSQFLFDDISVTNTFPKRIVQLGFWADVVPQRLPAVAAICCLTSKVMPVELDPGQSVTVPVHFISAADLQHFKSSVGPSLQAMLSPTFATFEDGTSWVGGAPPAETPASIPRFLVSPSAPQGPSDSRIWFCYDAEEKETSEGGVMAIRDELGHFARCTNGRWVETDIGVPPEAFRQGRARLPK